ncbi:MAG: hypothetical protein QF466_07095 [Desulfobacterales bacterium]|nr:hypothetical protein [Desulfobacterales bacterium]MDP6681503.1 hypothetical protein [Desulfobacterales bacterium]MDP6808861.1 hypothetical protein [Desulfobacterales bacterium]
MVLLTEQRVIVVAQDKAVVGINSGMFFKAVIAYIILNLWTSTPILADK